MSRQWAANGVTGFKLVEVDAETRKHIDLDLRTKGITSEIPDAFYKSLGDAISAFNAGRKLAEETKPAKVRANLQAAFDAALELNNKLNDLDGNSRQLLGEVKGGEISMLHDLLWKIIQALNEASHLADEYPKRGRLPEHERLWLAVNVADAISTYLGVAPTTTKGGIFESVLTSVLGVATDAEVSNVHDLACQALKARQEPHDVIERLPPKVD